jgi:hypothetical protein
MSHDLNLAVGLVRASLRIGIAKIHGSLCEALKNHCFHNGGFPSRFFRETAGILRDWIAMPVRARSLMGGFSAERTKRNRTTV